MPDTDLSFWATMWIVAAAIGMLRHWTGRSSVGLVFTYILSFGAIHWLAAAMYLLPWYTERGEDLVALGLRQATLAMMAFAIGAELVRILVKQHTNRRARVEETASSLDPLAVNVYLVSGLLLYVVISPLAGRVSGLQALVATGSTIIVVALSLKCWNGWQQAKARILWRWLGVSALMPLFTVMTQGFLGYGFAATMTILAFVSSFFRPRWKVVVAGLVAVYLGLSVYVTYMRDRSDIRAVVWGGKSLNDRTNQLTDTFGAFEWFNVKDQRHLRRVDDRLNQDFLVGAAVVRLEEKFVTYADGGTLLDAAFGVIPRALWPNKPTSAGSGDLVSIYTGMRFAEGTSVGVGQVMECYINFGTAGVIGGFLIIGALLTLADIKAAHALQRGDPRAFTLWYLPGLSLLQVGGSLIEVTSTAAAALVMAVLINVLIVRLHHRAAMRSDMLVVGSAPPEARW